MKARIDEFLHFLTVEKGYSHHTIAAYQNDLAQLSDFLSNRELTSWPDVDRNTIQQYILHLKERGYAASTVSRKVASTKSFFHFLVRDGFLSDDPTAAVDSPSADRHLPHPLSPDQVARLLAVPAQDESRKGLRDQALLELMYATGMRASEIVNLSVDEVDLDEKTVRCMGKGKKERILPLYEGACKTLNTYLQKSRPELARGHETEALFLNHRGQRLTRQGLWLIVKECAESANINREVTPHTLRHTFATHLLDGGAGLREVQQLLGHTNISSTQIYTEVSTRRKREAYDQAHPRA